MKVIIIGGGLGGPVLALALQQHNISSKIFELRDEHASDGGSIALAPNALRVLDRVGVYDRISKQGYNFEEFHLLSSRNLSRIGTFLMGSQHKYGYKALRIFRGIVRHTLLELLRERGIELRYNSKLVDVQETERSTVIATFADGHTEEADFLVGADGIHSHVRTHLHPQAVPRFSGKMGIGGEITRSKLPNSGKDVHMPCLILGKGNSFLFLPCSPDGEVVSCSASVEAEDRSREEWTRLGKDKQRLYEELQVLHEKEDWPDIVHVASKELDKKSLSLWPFYKLPDLNSWTSPSGRVIIIGDAAHAMPPTGGQGAAMAFEDGVTLGDALALVDSNRIATAPTLRRWQTARRERIKKVLEFTTTGGDVRKASSSTYVQIVKEWLMWAYLSWFDNDLGTKYIYGYDTKTAMASAGA
ncbi:hypothetical protein ABEF95_011847 [Exophiala dermatitidis]